MHKPGKRLFLAIKKKSCANCTKICEESHPSPRSGDCCVDKKLVERALSKGGHVQEIF